MNRGRGDHNHGRTKMSKQKKDKKEQKQEPKKELILEEPKEMQKVATTTSIETLVDGIERAQNVLGFQQILRVNYLVIFAFTFALVNNWIVRTVFAVMFGVMFYFFFRSHFEMEGFKARTKLNNNVPRTSMSTNVKIRGKAEQQEKPAARSYVG
jgi:hypothetical protein